MNDYRHSQQDYDEFDDDYGPLSRRQAENIADLASRRAEARMYAKIGRSVVKKALYLLGAACSAIFVYMSGYVHFGPIK